MYDNHKPTDFFWGAVLGGTVATLVSLLFTTKKGKQIQNQIGTLFEDGEEAVKEAASSAKTHLEDAADHISRKISSKKEEHHHQHKDSK